MQRVDVIVETERLAVCSPCEADATALAAIWADPRVTRFLGGPRDLEEVRRSIVAGLADPPPIDLWPVIEKTSGAIVGHCGLVPKEVDGRDEVELVYVIAADHWGRGYATEAAAAIRDYAFNVSEIDRLVALIDPENGVSERVAVKMGMTFERETVRPSGKRLRVYRIAGQ